MANFDWAALAAQVNNLVVAAEPAIDMVAPGAGSALHIAESIFQGAIAGAPTAIALVNQITSGTPATPAQLQQYSADYEASYQKLKADIAAKLAALPPA